MADNKIHIILYGKNQLMQCVCMGWREINKYRLRNF